MAIKKFFRRFGKALAPDNNPNKNNSSESTITLQTLSAAKHLFNENSISSAAIRVLRKLKETGYEAYLVGGGVRDLLIGLHPKDFDVATNATPEELVKLFHNARMIGRRFRIVHIRYGREVIEVTTFRGHHQTKSSSREKQHSKNGMLLRDNVYGTIEEDAVRRDFTVNALYYCHNDKTVYDYVGGLTDLKKRQIKIIGDPVQRYREDPVRMLRAVRLAAKLDFNIEDNTAEQITPLKHLLKDVPSARLFDECLKLFMYGHAEKTFLSLQQYDLFSALFPATQEIIDRDPFYQRFIQQALANTDERILSGKRVTPAYLFAALLWPVFIERIKDVQQQQQTSSLQIFYPVAETVVEQCLARVSLPRRFSTPLKEIWQLQFRLPRRHGKNATKVFTHPRFRAAYDFVLLRESVGENLNSLGQWWTDYQEANEEQRIAMSRAFKSPQNSRRSRKRSNKSRSRRNFNQ